MLGAGAVVMEPPCVMHRELHHSLAAGRQGDVLWRDWIRACAHDRLQRSARSIERDAQPIEERPRHSSRFAYSADEDVGRADVVVVQTRCLVLRESQSAPGRLGEARILRRPRHRLSARHHHERVATLQMHSSDRVRRSHYRSTTMRIDKCATACSVRRDGMSIVSHAPRCPPPPLSRWGRGDRLVAPRPFSCRRRRGLRSSPYRSFHRRRGRAACRPLRVRGAGTCSASGCHRD